MSKGKQIALRILVICVIISVAAYILYESKYDGSTPESRQTLLNEAIDGSLDQISIVNEAELEDYLITAFTLPDERIGLAVFEPTGKKEYKFQTGHWQFGNKLDMVQRIHGKEYQITWCKSEAVETAEMKCTETDGKNSEIRKLDVSGNQIAVYEIPYSNYKIEIAYYDSKGNQI